MHKVKIIAAVCERVGLTYEVRCVGLTWSLFLIGHLFFEWCMAKRLLVKKRGKKEVCCDEIELCAKKIGTVLGSVLNTIGRVYVIS